MKEPTDYPPIDKAVFKQEYEAVGLVVCPYFEGEVTFNAKGFNHVFFKGNRSEREFSDSQTRMRLFKRAVALLKLVNTHSGYFCDMRGSKPMHYWEFIAVMDNRRINVIVRQKGNGEKHFWSVIPSWKIIDGAVVNSGGKIAELTLK